MDVTVSLTIHCAESVLAAYADCMDGIAVKMNGTARRRDVMNSPQSRDTLSIILMQIRRFHPDDEKAVIQLWRRCQLLRPWNDPRKDIQRKLGVQPEMFLVGVIDRTIVGSIMAGYEGHRGWINYLAVDPDYGRRGFGRMLMNAAEELLRQAGCPKINLQIRASNDAVVAFYRKLGYTVDEVVSMGKRLERDEPPANA